MLIVTMASITVLCCKQLEQQPASDTHVEARAQTESTDTVTATCRLSRTIANIKRGEAFRRAVDVMERKLAMGKVATEGDSVIHWRITMEGPPYELSVTFSTAPHGATTLTMSSTQTNESAAAVSEKNWLDVLQKGIVKNRQ